LIVALVLAAGDGSRIGTPKATLEINGERFVDRAVSIFKKAGCAEVYVVLGAWVGEVVGAKVIVNEDWKEGMGSSLRIGLSHISSLPEVEGVLVSLVDLPGLTSEAAERILMEPGEIVIGTYGGKPGHPVKFSREHWQAIIASAVGEVGARSYLAHRSDVHYVDISDLASGNDVDTQEDLARFFQD
jgi:CTP:molybdopterin cytidylyltransferase MocA